MKLLKRLAFAIKYDIEPDFIVHSIPDQHAVQFMFYEDAREFSDNQIQYRPKVMVAVVAKPREDK